VSREDNVAIVRRAWGDPLKDPGIFSVISEDLDYRAIEGAPDDVGVMRGRDAYIRYLGDWAETFEDFRAEAEEVDAIDDERVLVVGRIAGRARGSGVETEQRVAVLYTVRDGLIVRGREYQSKEEALAAAAAP
jgi:ketosteroid isomerase-like protein